MKARIFFGFFSSKRNYIDTELTILLELGVLCIHTRFLNAKLRPIIQKFIIKFLFYSNKIKGGFLIGLMA